jgi:hypothetical protein
MDVSPVASNEHDAVTSGQLLDHLIYHVLLPPKSIQGADTSIEKEHTIISSLLESVRRFSRDCSVDESQQLKAVIRMLQRLLKVKPGLETSNKRAAMREVIRDLEVGGMYIYVVLLPLHNTVVHSSDNNCSH